MFLRGAETTFFISIISTLIGFVIGLGIGVVRTMPEPQESVKRIILKS